jgi:hypothetical protein
VDAEPGAAGKEDARVGLAMCANFLMEELHSFVGEGWEQEDDITLLTLKRSTFLC